MRAMVLGDIAKLELREVPRPVVQQYEVLVRVSAVGLCGTDFHIFSGQANYNINQQGKVIPLVEQPQILGHELVGIVEEVGSTWLADSQADRCNFVDYPSLPVPGSCASSFY